MNGKSIIFDQPFYEDLKRVVTNLKQVARRKGLSYDCILIAIEPHFGRYVYRQVPGEPGPDLRAVIQKLRALMQLKWSGLDKAAQDPRDKESGRLLELFQNLIQSDEQ